MQTNGPMESTTQIRRHTSHTWQQTVAKWSHQCHFWPTQRPPNFPMVGTTQLPDFWSKKLLEGSPTRKLFHVAKYHHRTHQQINARLWQDSQRPFKGPTSGHQVKKKKVFWENVWGQGHTHKKQRLNLTLPSTPGDKTQWYLRLHWRPQRRNPLGPNRTLPPHLTTQQ